VTFTGKFFQFFATKDFYCAAFVLDHLFSLEIAGCQTDTGPMQAILRPNDNELAYRKCRKVFIRESLYFLAGKLFVG
jgi:hypothetical protein